MKPNGSASSLAKRARHEPPAPDEAEVSLFGPGIGESAVVHLGGGDWIVIDSCVETGTREPVAVKYLANLGLHSEHSLRLIIVSHWHDDHIRGISSVLQAAPHAVIACSAALNSDEFFQLTAFSRRAMTEWPGTAEFEAVLAILEQRAPAGVRPAAIGPTWAVANQRLWQRSATGSIPSAEVYALSPSAAALTLAINGFADMLPVAGPARKLVALTPNQAAVAVWIVFGSFNILLGSDLEASTNPLIGWHAIITSQARPTGLAHVFKVPHHGSDDADEPAVWTTMLVPNPCAVLTPFIKGPSPLPRPTDISRLKARTNELYCTAAPKGWAPPRRDPAVERTLRETVRARRAISGPMGHVRIRAQHSAPNSLQVDLFNGAHRL
ncbi:MAG: MBL fold metallo-hydrolase [Candidatus Rokubacteria bacterium]|nr:MBL fold metallo-hydrolase [Candidatus Rokubacteria bacterium]